MIDSDDAKVIRYFYENDVKPRLLSNLNDAQFSVTQDIRDILGDNLVTTRNISIADFGATNPWGGFSYGINDLMLNSRHLKDPLRRQVTLAHEIHHSGRKELAERLPNTSRAIAQGNPYGSKPLPNLYRNSGYTQQEAEVLDQAYRFSDEYLKAHPGVSPLDEKAATNTEMRLRLHKASGGKTGKALDRYIDQLSDEDLRAMYFDNYANGYAKDFSKSFDKDSYAKIRKALKYAAVVTPLVTTNSNKND